MFLKCATNGVSWKKLSGIEIGFGANHGKNRARNGANSIPKKLRLVVRIAATVE